MNKIFGTLVVCALGLALVKSVSAAGNVDDGWAMKTSTGTSFNIIPAKDGFSGARIVKVWASSDTAVVPTNWFQLFNVANSSVPSYAFLNQAKALTPPMYFPIPSTATLNIGSYGPIFDFGEDGIKVSTGCFLYKSGDGSGAALQVTIQYR